MKKKLFGLFLFSLILSSLAYAKIRDAGNQRLRLKQKNNKNKYNKFKKL